MNKCDYILKNEEKYSQNAELIDVALNEFTEHVHHSTCGNKKIWTQMRNCSSSSKCLLRLKDSQQTPFPTLHDPTTFSQT